MGVIEPWRPQIFYSSGTLKGQPVNNRHWPTRIHLADSHCVRSLFPMQVENMACRWNACWLLSCSQIIWLWENDPSLRKLPSSRVRFKECPLWSPARLLTREVFSPSFISPPLAKPPLRLHICIVRPQLLNSHYSTWHCQLDHSWSLGVFLCLFGASRFASLSHFFPSH